GKTRLHRASSMYAWQFSRKLAVSQANGRTRFFSMQNLLYREEEREMLPLCKANGIGLIPWSTLARSRFTSDWSAQSDSSGTDESGKGFIPEPPKKPTVTLEWRLQGLHRGGGCPEQSLRWHGFYQNPK